MNSTDNKSRRTFIKTSAVLAGGAVLSNLPFSGVYASGSGAIKIAVVGCGQRGTAAALQALSTKYDVKLVAMADAFKDNVDKSLATILAKTDKNKVDVPASRQFSGFEAYKDAIKEADVVLLATPPGFRPAHFEEAVRQNKHVFMEKPVAIDSPGIRKVLAAAEEAKRKKLNVVTGLQRRYQNSYRETMKRIEDGAIGDVVAGQVYWNSGGVWVRPRTAGQTEMEYQMRNWYYFNWLCGDHILEQHVHNIDVANWAKNAYPVSAYGTGSRFMRTGKDHGEIFDNHTVEFAYDDGSVFMSQCRHHPGCKNRVDETLIGSKGKAFFSANSNTGKLWDKKGGELYVHDGKNNPNPYQTEHDELFAAISAGQYKYADAERTAKSTLTALMGRYATYSGEIITWDQALNSEINLMPDRLAWDALPKVLPGPDGYYPCAIPGQTKVI